MGRSHRPQFPDTVFHVVARGNARQQIFFEANDWERFIKICADLKSARPFKLYAYCLMTNHIHLLLEPTTTSISTTIGLILNRYAKYLNARLGRTGHVFEGRFKSRLCGKDPYLQQVVRYIHLNPVNAGMVVDPSAWPYSGHLEYIGRSTTGLIDQDLLLPMFHNDPGHAKAAYIRFINDGMPGKPGNTLPAFLEPATPDIKPPPTSGWYVEAGRSRANILDIAAGTHASAGLPLEVLLGASKVPNVVRARREFMRQAFRAGYSFTEIATHLHITAQAVSKALTNFT